MKKSAANIFITGISLVLFGGCAQTNYPDSFVLTGNLKGVPAGVVKLVKYNEEDRTSLTVDSAELKEGTFHMEGKVESAEMMHLVVEPGNWTIPVFMENNTIAVQADTAGAAYFDWTAYGGEKGAEVKNYTVSGSESQDAWVTYQKDSTLKKYEPQFVTLQKAYQTAGSNKEKASAVKEQIDSLRQLQVALQQSWIDRFVSAHPSSAAGTYIFHNFYLFNESMPLQDMEALLNKFDGPAKSTVYFKSLSEALRKRKALQPGNVAPDFTLRKPDSSTLTLSSLRGKYVLLDFWASWCVPCRKAIPHWKQLYQKYQPKGFEILAITNDSKWSDWFKALEEEKMPWIQVADEFPLKNMPARVGELYKTPYLPFYVLLDKEGKIILHHGTKEQIEEKLKEVFGS